MYYVGVIFALFCNKSLPREKLISFDHDFKYAFNITKIIDNQSTNKID